MNILAIDSSTPELKLFWVSDSVYKTRQVAPSVKHSEMALPLIKELAKEIGLEISSLTHIVVGVGPGMFTGVRVAITLAQGLAYGLGLPIYAASSLTLFAASVPEGERAWVVQDARCQAFYAAIFQRKNDELLMINNVLCLDEEAMHKAIKESKVFNIIGTGCDLINFKKEVNIQDAASSDDIALWLRSFVAKAKPEEPSKVEPIYLREAVF